MHIETIFLKIIVMEAMMAKPRPGHAEERRYFKEVRFRQIRALFEISRRGFVIIASITMIFRKTVSMCNAY